MFRLTNILAFLFFFIVLHIDVVGQENPSAAEIIAGFEQNFHKFKTLRITGYRSVAFQENARKRMIRHKMSSTEIQTMMLARHLPVQFWTDRKGFQVRWPRASDSKQYSASFKFPETPWNEATIAKEYGDFCAFTSQGDYEQGVTLWGGMLGLEKKPMGATNFNPQNSYEECKLPALAGKQAATGLELHPIDSFFFTRPESIECIGSEIVDGLSLLILRKVEKSDELTKAWSAENSAIEAFWRTTAWVDPERGFLPTKIEKEGYFVCEQKHFYNPWGIGPDFVTTCSKLTEIPDGGFYPLLTKTVRSGLATEESALPFFTPAQIVNGKKQTGLNSASDEEWQWVASEVRADIEMENMFAFGLPPNARYYDHRTHRQAGLTPAETESTLAGIASRVDRLNQPVAGSARMYLLVANIACMLLIIIGLTWRTKRRASATSQNLKSPEV